MTLYKYVYRDNQTNEIFSFESSFVIPNQAIAVHPKFTIAKFERAFGNGFPIDQRFDFVGSKRIEIETEGWQG